MGADDYITKPFDIEELKLRVQGAIRRSERESLTDPRSGLPAGRLIEEQLRRIIREKGWALLDARVNNFDSFKDVYGFVAGDDVLRFTAMMIGEVVDELGTNSDFIGHAGGDNFIIITKEEKADRDTKPPEGKISIMRCLRTITLLIGSRDLYRHLPPMGQRSRFRS